jgi:hypothetical protein
MPNKKTKKQLKAEGKTQKEIDLYFGINEKTGRPIKWTEQKAMELANELIEWMKSSDNNIFFERFLVENKEQSPQIVSELSKKFKSFSEAIKRARKIQEYKIIDMGTMRSNSTFAMFLLKSNHGYIEEYQKQTKEMKIQELELKKQMLEITKKQHENDEVEHVIRFNGERTIINP